MEDIVEPNHFGIMLLIKILMQLYKHFNIRHLNLVKEEKMKH